MNVDRRVRLLEGREVGIMKVAAGLSNILNGFVSAIGVFASSTRQPETYNSMHNDNSYLQTQREALRSFIAVQVLRKQMEVAVGFEWTKGDVAIRQKADVGVSKINEEFPKLDKLKAVSKTNADGLMQSVNYIWEETQAKLNDADLARLQSDPGRLVVSSDGRGDISQTLLQCNSTAAESRDAVLAALIELREFNEWRTSAILISSSCAALILFVLYVYFNKP